MQTNSSHLSKPTAVVILVITIGVILAGGAYLLKEYVPADNQQVTTSDNTNSIVQSENVDTSDWIFAPYFSDLVNFTFYYPSDWELANFIDPGIVLDDHHDGSPLVWVSTSEFAGQKTNEFGVYYWQDTGDDLETWANKRKQLLQKEHGTEPIIQDIELSGQPAIQQCYDAAVTSVRFPSCHIFFSSQEYIIELRIEGNKGALNYVRDLTAAFVAQFSILTTNNAWQQYSNNNAGFAFTYPSEEIEIKDDPIFSVSAFGSAGQELFTVNSVLGTDSLIEYWYQTAKQYDINQLPVPQELYLDTADCLYADMSRFDLNYTIDQQSLYCEENDRVYEIIIPFGADSPYVQKVFSILSSISFTNKNSLGNNTYLLHVDDPGFELVYPASFMLSALEDWGGTYIGFEENTDDGLHLKKFSISYLATPLSIQECVDDENECYIVEGELSAYRESTFASEEVLELSYQEDLYDAQPTNNRIILLKRNGFIIKIEIVTDQEGNNTKLNSIINSFSFI